MNWNIIEFLSLILLIIGAITIKYNYLLSKILILIACNINFISVLKPQRTKADIIKAVGFMVMITGLILIQLIAR